MIYITFPEGASHQVQSVELEDGSYEEQDVLATTNGSIIPLQAIVKEHLRSFVTPQVPSNLI